MSEKKLKIWNGRTLECRGHFYACGYSKNDVLKMLNEYADKNHQRDYTMYEANNFWNPNAWGTQMDGIERERGLWIVKDSFGSKAKPKRFTLSHD